MFSSSLINRLLSPKSSTPASNRTRENRNKHEDGAGDEDEDIATSSHYQKTVRLYNWWLVKADKDYEGNRLSVAGYPSTERQAMRVFTSAPIVKRYDNFSLETSDGIYIVIRGLINKSRTMENGFSCDVFSHFNVGFHRDWKVYAEKFFTNAFKEAADPKSGAGVENSNPNTVAKEWNLYGKSKHNAEDVNTSYNYASVTTLANGLNNFHSSGRAADCIDIDTNNAASTDIPPFMSCDKMNIGSLEDNLIEPSPGEPSGYHVRRISERIKPNAGDINKSSDYISDTSPANVPKHCHSPDNTDQYDIVKASNHVSAPLTGWDKTNIGSPEENLVVHSPEEPSGCHVRGASERMANSTIKRNGTTGALTKSKIKERSRSERTTLRNVVSQNSPYPEGSDVGITNSSNLDPAVSLGTRNVASRKSPIPEGSDASNANLSYLEAAVSLGARNVESKKSPAPEGSDVGVGTSNLDPAVLLGDSVALTISSGKHKKRKDHDKGKDGLNYIDKNRTLIKKLQGMKRNVTIVSGLQVEGSEKGSVAVLSDDGDFQKKSHGGLLADKLTAAQDQKRKSQAGSTRQNKNNLVTPSCGPGNRNHDSSWKTAVTDQERSAKVVSSRKKAQRKIIFDADARPHTRERKEKCSIVSPESLSLKRSRSGRLLLPPLDFWRNQSPVYDADRKITGIQEGLDILRSPKGSGMRPEPPKGKRQKN